MVTAIGVEVLVLFYWNNNYFYHNLIKMMQLKQQLGQN